MKIRLRKKLTARLMAAVLGGDVTTVRAVLRAGIDPARPDRTGTTPLYLAAVQGEAAVARVLLAAGAPPDAESGLGGEPNDEGTPLCAAAAHGHVDAVRVLLAGGADPTLREDGGSGLTPLEWAVRSGDQSTVDALRAAAVERYGR